MVFSWQGDFIAIQGINLTVLVMTQYFNGLLVMHRGVKVNYTRKINHFMLFFIPVFIGSSYVYESEFWLYALGAFLAVAKFVFYVKPVRDRVPLIHTMFLSFDRPEDRPHTLLWITTQTGAGYLVLLPMSVVFSHYGIFELMLIPILIYGLGDGLAEPVGVRFGRLRYRAYALFSRRRYYRTIEGSAVVFLAGLLVVGAYSTQFSPQQFIAALFIVPAFTTLAEALSPHTWDSPFMFLAGYLALLLVTFI